MKIKDYVTSLRKIFTKSNVISDVKNTREEMEDVTLPAFEGAVKVFQRRKLVSPALINLQTTFENTFPTNAENIVVTIEKHMAAAIRNLKELEGVVEKTYNNEVTGLGLSYRKANLLQLVEAYSFVSRYARKLLNFAYVCETGALEAKAQGGATSDDRVAIEKEILPADMDYLKMHIVYFAQLYAVVSGLGRHKDVVKAIEDIPDVEVKNDNAEMMASTMGIDKVDPFRMGFIPVWLNPVYHIGIAFAEWQVARFNAAEEELRMLQLRKIKLEKRLDDNKSDAKVEQQLEHMRKRVNELEIKLVKMRNEV